MNELKKLIEAAKAVATSCQFHHYSLLADVDALRATIPAAEAELAGMGWVSVSEPPTEEGWYIVAVRPEPRSRLGYWHKASQGWSADYKTVTHWQPLPAPPSEPEEKL